MSRLDDLIDELCPDGVEYLLFRDIVEKNVGGGTPSKSKPQYWNGDIPWASVKDVVRAGMVIQNTLDHITEEGLNNCPANIVPKDWLIICTRINPGLCAIADKDIAINQDLRGVCFQQIANVKYVWYYFQTMDIIGKGTTVKGISIDELDRITVPIPPLPVQQEIVRILDTFTALEAELEAELEARKKQYAYYRDDLLTFDLEAPKGRLGDICTVITKGTTPKTYQTSGVTFVKTEAFDGSRIVPEKLSYVDEETHHGFLKRSILQADDILITIAGATIGKCVMVPANILPANTNQALAIIRLANGNSKKYVMYILQSKHMKDYMQSSIKGSAQPNLNLKQLNDFVIPLPSLEEQERIVAILDRFDALVNDITQGLPAEIAARRKQYEYYRDKLLTFKEKVS